MSEEKHNISVEYIKRKVLDSFAKENFSNSMTTTKGGFCILWRPNNYRRQMVVKEKNNSTIKKILSTIPNAKLNNHTKLVNIKGYEGITIQYGKSKLVGIWSQHIVGGCKETYLIEANSIQDVECRILEKKEEIKKKIDKALRVFAKKVGIGIPYSKPVWSRYEDWVKGESYIDQLPRECIVHDTFFKKVYGEGIEFKKAGKEEPGVHLKNYIKNRAVEDFSPEIAKEIGLIKEGLLEGINDVMKKTDNLIRNNALELQVLCKAQLTTQKQLGQLIQAISPHKKDVVAKDEVKTRPDYFG